MNDFVKTVEAIRQFLVNPSSTSSSPLPLSLGPSSASSVSPQSPTSDEVAQLYKSLISFAAELNGVKEDLNAKPSTTARVLFQHPNMIRDAAELITGFVHFGPYTEERFYDRLHSHLGSSGLRAAQYKAALVEVCVKALLNKAYSLGVVTRPKRKQKDEFESLFFKKQKI